jgi:large subunit ribosomal protein L18e
MDAKADPSNPVLVDLIEELESSDADVYREAAEFLGKVNRDRPEVNLSDLDRNTEEGDTVVVPGKVLGSGNLGHELEIAAFKASRSAKQAANEVGDFMHIEELVEERPDGEEVEIVV